MKQNLGVGFHLLFHDAASNRYLPSNTSSFFYPHDAIFFPFRSIFLQNDVLSVTRIYKHTMRISIPESWSRLRQETVFTMRERKSRRDLLGENDDSKKMFKKFQVLLRFVRMMILECRLTFLQMQMHGLEERKDALTDKQFSKCVEGVEVLNG